MANRTALAARIEMSRLNTRTVYFQGILCRMESTRNMVLSKQLVGDGIEILAEQMSVDAGCVRAGHPARR